MSGGPEPACILPGMSMRPPQIVAFGGGGFSMEAGNPLLDDYVLEVTGRERPKVCFVPTASGDADHYIVRFYRRFASVADTSHVSLFRRDKGAGAVEGNLESHLLAQDLIYVGGGSVLSLLGTWRAHGLDAILERAWRRGVTLCGLSAGSLCWFAEALTAFHGPPEPVHGLGLLPHSNCVHYDGEAERGAVFRRLVADGRLREGYAAQDGAALHFEGHELLRVVSSRPHAQAFRVSADGEHPLAVRFLGQPVAAALAAA
jgi:dipeptidase E